MNTGSHFQDDVLEKYAMGKLSEVECAPLEEHLLICSSCQDRLESVEDYIRVAKAATAALTPQPPARKRRAVPSLATLRNIPKPVWSIAIAALLLIVLIPRGLAPSPQTEVVLTTTRGATSWFPSAPEGRLILLRIDATQILRADGYQLELVDPTGQPIWHAHVEATNNQIAARLPKRLRAGRYWIRLYDTGNPWTLLREYGLNVE